MGENHFASLPVAIYGGVLFMAAVAYYILARLLVAHHGHDSKIALAIGKDVKGILSFIGYLVAIPFAFSLPLLSVAIYVSVTMMWLIPDRRIERKNAI